MNKRNSSKITFIASILVILFSGLLAIGQTKPENLITATSVGDIKLGMTIGEARKALPSGFKLAPGGGSEGVTFVGVYDGDKHLMDIGEYEESEGGEGLPPINDDQKISGIAIIDSRFKTADGVHVGMSIDDAEKKYGKLKEMFNYPHEGEFGSFTNQPEYLQFYFKPKGNLTEAGIYEAVPDCAEDAYPPSCRKAVKYNPDSYISEMSVRSPQPIQKVVSITDSPSDYKVYIYGPAECVDDEVSLTTYAVSWKVPMENGGYGMPSQSFEFEGLLPCPEKGYGTDDTSVSYKDQWDVYLDDFNFDGMTDLALRDGNNGGYGFASYQVYLFSKADNKYVLNSSLTELGQFQGMFEIDKQKKMIFNSTKDGCCFYQTDGFRVVNNQTVRVYEKTTDYSAPAMTEGNPMITTKKLINGNWEVVPNEPEAKKDADTDAVGLIILDLNTGGVLGTFKDGKFGSGEDIYENIKPTDSFELFGLGMRQESLQFKELMNADRCRSYPCGEGSGGLSGVALSSNISWNPVPRKTTVLDKNNGTYRKIVQDIAAEKGISNPDVEIHQILRVDLEGDGQDEIIIAAGSNTPKDTNAYVKGNYALLMVRKIVGGKVKNILLDGWFNKSQAEQVFLHKGRTFEITSVLDLDADGILEIVAFDYEHEGAGSVVHKINGEKSIKVLNSGDGA